MADAEYFILILTDSETDSKQTSSNDEESKIDVQVLNIQDTTYSDMVKNKEQTEVLEAVSLGDLNEEGCDQRPSGCEIITCDKMTDSYDGHRDKEQVIMNGECNVLEEIKLNFEENREIEIHQVGVDKTFMTSLDPLKVNDFDEVRMIGSDITKNDETMNKIVPSEKNNTNKDGMVNGVREHGSIANAIEPEEETTSSKDGENVLEGTNLNEIPINEDFEILVTAVEEPVDETSLDNLNTGCESGSNDRMMADLTFGDLGPRENNVTLEVSRSKEMETGNTNPEKEQISEGLESSLTTAVENFDSQESNQKNQSKKNRKKYHLSQNQEKGSDGWFRCKFCKQEYRDKGTLRWHLNYKHNEKAEWHQCVHCDYKTKDKSNLRKHVATRHTKKEYLEDSKRFECYICGFKSTYKSNLAKHIIQRHYRDQLKILHCQVCDFKTKYRGHLNNHFLIEHDKTAEWHECHLCSYRTKIKARLKHHNKLHNPNIEMHRCMFCDFQTKHKSCLRHHLVKHNDQTEWLRCHFCDHKAKTKRLLRDHVKSKHDQNTEMYQCLYCEYKTKRKASFNYHFKVKHDVTAKWYQCYECNYKTKVRYFLLHHLKIHSGINNKMIYECKFCQYKTTNRRHLITHRKVEHADKKCHCDTCSRPTNTLQGKPCTGNKQS